MKKSRFSESQIVAIFQQQEAALDGNNLPQGPYAATLISANNYYPFGMLQPGRHWTASEYRYGYNGKEMDHEVSGEGNQYDYGFRIYNPRIAKFLSVDPATARFPMLSAYIYADNSPIAKIDVQGLWAWVANEAVIKQYLTLPATLSAELVSIVDYHTFDIVQMQNSINKMYRVWNNPSDRHYAPAVAKFLKDEQISITIGVIGKDSHQGVAPYGRTTLVGRHILLNTVVTRRNFSDNEEENERRNQEYNKESVLLHEIVHTMGFHEFGAFSAQLAAGYISTDELKSRYRSAPHPLNALVPDYTSRQYFLEGITDDISMELFGTDARTAAVHNYEFKAGKTIDDLLTMMYNHGRGIISGTVHPPANPEQDGTDE